MTFDQQLLTASDARRCQTWLDRMEADLMAADSSATGVALGQIWVLAEKARTSDDAHAFKEAQARLASLYTNCVSEGLDLDAAITRPCADPWSVVMTAEHFWLMFGGRDPHPDLPALALAALKKMPATLRPAHLHKAVQFGRFLVGRKASHPDALAIYLDEILPRLAGPSLQARHNLDPIQGLAALLSTLADASALLGRSSVSLDSLSQAIHHAASFKIQDRGQVDLGRPWSSDKSYDKYWEPEDKRLRLALAGHLGTWTLLADLHQRYPSWFTKKMCQQTNTHLQLLSKFSYYVHKRIGYSATCTMEPSLLLGAAGNLFCFQKIHQRTQAPDHLLNVRLWARRLADLMELDAPKNAWIRSGQLREGRLAFLPDRTLGEGSAGVWLALWWALHPSSSPGWAKLLM